MAGSSDVVKRVLRFKLQLSDSPQSATVLKILQKLNHLDITVDVLAETGIGRTVNSFRKHKEAGELAKSLVKGWKKLIPKKSTSDPEDGNISDNLFISDQNHLKNGAHIVEDFNNNCKDLKNLTEKCHIEKIHDPKNKKDKCKTSDKDDPKTLGNGILSLKNAFLEDKCDYSVSKHKKNGDCKSRSYHLAQVRHKSGLDCGGSSLKRKKDKSKPSKKPQRDCAETSSHDKPSEKSPDLNNARLDISPSSSDNQNRKRKKEQKERKDESEHDDVSEPSNKKAKIQQENSESELEEPSMSFESYLNYDQEVSKKHDRPRGNKISKRINIVIKELPPVKHIESPRIPVSPKKMFLESPKDHLHIPIPTFLPECDKASSFEYLEKKVEKEPDFEDLPEDSTFFTGQRLNKKMQVYSGAKTVFLPTMMSLYQQCIRTLQNNINLLYETGGVPFEILEPVLEKCTPEQLLRIEECNPVYIGVTDHLWGKHCQRDFKDAKLQQYESWKEMYIRLSEERERKFQSLAKKIILDHSKKPKGRQVKMAFIHTVAKPPRDVRIQQEIHGTAVQQPQQPKSSVKSQDSRSRLSNESAKNNSSSSSGTQDPRKKTRVAPMMAKSLKAFKKQLGRR
ncbi:elongin A, like isoform X2 [Syngnathus scovelli]|uniref:elongin A, like isoform X2 n=1 Tax=Syngnathus scovelli TaxID=161590 RepID=UPI0021104BA1|nr:elongin A, like isoform X2 [Syngnathus scovelli]